MGSHDETVEIDVLERHLLSDSLSSENTQNNRGETVIYTASFEEMEDQFVKYQITQWILYSLVLILAWGIGLIMLLYLPIRVYICRKDFRSRKLYLTPDAIIYKVTRPVIFPCFGNLKKEKYVILPSVADVIIEQGYLQSLFGIYSIRIENSGVRKPASDDVKIQGVALPVDFQKAVLVQISNMKREEFEKQASTSSVAPPGDLILQKLEEVESSVKKIEALIERGSHTSQTIE